MDGFEEGAPTHKIFKILSVIGTSCEAFPLAFQILQRWTYSRRICGEQLLNERALAIMMVHVICQRRLNGLEDLSKEDAATEIITNFFKHFNNFDFRTKVITFDVEGDNLKRTQREPEEREGDELNKAGERMINSYIQVRDPVTNQNLTPDVSAPARYQHIRRELKKVNTLIQMNNGRPTPLILGLRENGQPKGFRPDYDDMRK
jgi:hypothetical protein